MKSAIIVDIDNTLVDFRDLERVYYKEPMNKEDWMVLESKYLDLDPIFPIVNLIKNYIDKDYTILFVTARMGKPHVIHKTLFMLKRLFNFKPSKMRLYMREEKDTRPDEIVKEEIFVNYIQPEYTIDFALDDKTEIKDLWLKYGILTLQVFQP